MAERARTEIALIPSGPETEGPKSCPGPSSAGPHRRWFYFKAQHGGRARPTRADMRPTIGLERTLPRTQPAVPSCHDHEFKLFSAETDHCRLIDRHVISPLPGMINIPTCWASLNLRPYFPQHGRTAAPLPWDSLSVSSRAICARWLCCFLRHSLSADGTTTGDLAFCKSHKGALRTLASYAPASTAGFVCIGDVSRPRRSDVKPLQKWTGAFAASLGARL